MGRPSNLSQAVKDYLAKFKPYICDNIDALSRKELDDFLEERGMLLDEWTKDVNRFFQKSIVYFRYKTTQDFMFESLGYDFSSEFDRTKFFTLIANAIENESTNIRRWVVGPSLPDPEAVRTFRVARNIKLPEEIKHKIESDALAARFSIARTLTYINLYPWDRFPVDDESLYANACWVNTMKALSEVEYYNNIRLEKHEAYRNQRVFDFICRKNPEAVFPEEKLGNLKNLVESGSDSIVRFVHETANDATPYDEFLFFYGVLGYSLKLAGSFKSLVDYAWIFDRKDADYNTV